MADSDDAPRIDLTKGVAANSLAPGAMNSEEPAPTAKSSGWHPAALAVVALLVIAAIAIGGWEAYRAPRGSAVIDARRNEVPTAHGSGSLK